MLKIGILKETKEPYDRRVALTPDQIAELQQLYPNTQWIVQTSTTRCFKDQEYKDKGIKLQKDVSHCDILIGIKEVEINALVPGKSYMFFSHTAKKQPHNKNLLKRIIRNKITLIDYEYLTDENNIRLVTFGRWAGIVGAYNGLRAFGLRNKLFTLKPAYQCSSKYELFRELDKVFLPPVKVLITGGGRVASGAREVLAPLEITRVTPQDFLKNTHNEAVFCQIEPDNYVRRMDGSKFEFSHFVDVPEEYESVFLPFTRVTDIFIAGHFWHQRSPTFITPEQMKSPHFTISVIADISCDINGPIPSTIRTSTIEEPFYGYNPYTGKEAPPFDEDCITVMAVDNLPGVLPRDASEDFGKKMIKKVLPSLLVNDEKGIIERATIVKKGMLTDRFTYLKDYAGL